LCCLTISINVHRSDGLEVNCGAAPVESVAIDLGYLSTPQAIEFPTENGLTAHAFFYPPQNRDYAAPELELPPLLKATADQRRCV